MAETLRRAVASPSCVPALSTRSSTVTPPVTNNPEIRACCPGPLRGGLMDFSAYFPFKPAFHPYLDEQESHVKVLSTRRNGRKPVPQASSGDSGRYVPLFTQRTLQGMVARDARYPAPKPGH